MNVTPPMLPVTVHGPEAGVSASEDRSRSRVAAASRGPISGNKTTNSSPPHARGNVAGPDAPAEPFGYGTEQLVARAMTEAVVYGLEVVEVDVRHGDGPFPAST
jgi:hypothetical protein